MTRRNRGITTVKWLIEELQKYDPEAAVWFEPGRHIEPVYPVRPWVDEQDRNVTYTASREPQEGDVLLAAEPFSME